GFDRDMKQKPTRAPIPLESQNGLKNKAGTVAMARTGDPNSATAQFFINVVDNPSLDYPQPDGNGYAVFGKVVEGMDTV
ncbi:peptidylprolyl isomerase, partial [Acinetobacter baumannii]